MNLKAKTAEMRQIIPIPEKREFDSWIIEKMLAGRIKPAQTVDKVPAKAGLFYVYDRFSDIIEISVERRCFL